MLIYSWIEHFAHDHIKNFRLDKPELQSSLIKIKLFKKKDKLSLIT